MQTKEDRIRRRENHWPPWMTLARRWEMPIKAIKKIVRENVTEEQARNQ